MEKLEFEKAMENIEQKVMEYETTISTLTTIIICFLKKNGMKIEIDRSVVEEVVNDPRANEYEFKFTKTDSGDGILELILPEEVEGAKRVAELHKTIRGK